MATEFWQRVDESLEISSAYRLSTEQRELIAKEEQAAYESNLETITRVLDEFKDNLDARKFWTDRAIAKSGLRFRYQMVGYYGPGGFTSQFHMAGPLVLAEINPKGNSSQSFYNNDIDQSTKIGADFNEQVFRRFVEQNVEKYLKVENLIITREQYDRIRDLYPH